MSGIPPTVDDSEGLHRLLIPQGGAIKDGRVHYMAFYSREVPHRISVDRAEYRPQAESLATWGNHCGIAALACCDVRGIAVAPHPNLSVDSVPENGNDAHAEIRAPEAVSKSAVKTKVCRRLADISTIVREPPPA